MAVQKTGLKYTSEGVDQFIQNVQKASKNLQDFTNSATASSRAVRGAASDLRLHTNSLNAMLRGSKSLAQANNIANTSLSSSSSIFSRLGQSSGFLHGSFTKLGSAISSIPKAFGGLASSIGSSTAQMIGFGKASQSTGIHLDAMIKRVVALSIIYGSVNVVQNWISTGYEQVLLYDQLQSSLSALIAKEMVETGQSDNMGDAWTESADRAKELTNWVEKLGILSIFESADIKNVMQMSMSVGILTEDAKALSLALVDWGSVVKATPHQLNTVTNALTDMFTKGRVQGEEMRQLTRNQIPAWTYLADAIGVTTAEARQMVTDGLVPADVGIKAIVDGIEKDFGGAAAKMSRTLVGLTSSLKDLKNISLRELFAPAIQATLPQLERFVSVLQTPEVKAKLNEWGAALGEAAVKALNFAEAMFASGDPIGFIALQIDKSIPGFFRFAESVKSLGSIFVDIASDAISWGFNIGASLAEGVVQAAIYIVEALSYIGSIISSWLSPGSPPKLLPDLDQWGRGAAEVYIGGWTTISSSDIGGSFAILESGIFDALNGVNAEDIGKQTATRYLKAWSSADMSALKDIEKPIRDFLDNMVKSGSMSEEGIIPALLGGRDAIAKAIQEIDSFGEVTSDTMSTIDDWVSSVNPELGTLVESFFEWEKASKAVKDAQEELNRINSEFEERISGIKDAYDETLGPLNKSLEANEKQQKALKDQERLRKLQETIESDESTGEEKRAAQLEIEELQIRQQIDAIKDRKDSELAAIEEQKEAAVDAATAALDQAKLQEEATKAAYDAKQAQIELQHSHNSLIAEQSRLLDSIAKKQEAEAKKASGGGGGFGGIPQSEKASFGGGPLGLDTGPLQELDKAIADLNIRADEAKKHWAELRLEFELARSKALEVKESLAPLEPLAAGIGMAFGIIAAGGIATFVARILGMTSPIGILITIGSVLYSAWQSNFMGIQDIASGLFSSLQSGASDVGNIWDTVLKPAIDSVAKFIVTDFMPVMNEVATIVMPLVYAAGNLLASLFVNIVLPAAGMLWSAFKEVGIPILSLVAGALTIVFNVVADYVLPVFKLFYDFMAESVFPILGSLIELAGSFGKVLGEVLRLAVEAVTLVVKDFFKAASDLGVKIGELIDWIFGPGSMDAALGFVSESFDDVVKLVSDFFSGLSSLKSIISDAIGWLNDLAETLSSISIPDDLLPGSPPPFAIGLMGVTDAINGLLESIRLVPQAFQGVNGVTIDIMKNLEDVAKKAADLVEDLKQSLLESQVSGIGESLSGFRFVNELYDDVVKARESVAELKEEYKKLMSEGKIGEAIEVSAQIASGEAQIEQLSKVQRDADNALTAAREEFVKLSKDDPENAKMLYDLKSKQIQDLANLDRSVALAKTDEERNRLLAERAFIVQQQSVELELFNRQAEERTKSLKSQIDEIAKAWADAWKDLTIGEGDPAFKAMQELYKWVVALQALNLPDWLQPGSPTPLEYALIGINNAVKELSSVNLPVLRAEFGRMSTPAGVSQIMSSVSTVYNNTNQYNLGVTTNRSPQMVMQSYEIMRSMNQ